MNTRLLIHSGLALALVTPGLFAQSKSTRPDEPKAASTVAPLRTMMSSGLLKSSQLIGMDVQNAKGEDCAEVRDLLVCDDGRVTGLLLSVEGVDDALVILPLGVITPHFEKMDVDEDEVAPNVGELDKLTLDIPLERLTTAPRVSTEVDNVAAQLTEERVKASYKHFGLEMESAMKPSKREGSEKGDSSAMPKTVLVQRVSKLMDCDVKNTADEDLGEIDELIVSLKDKRVSYAVMTRGGVLGMGSKQFAVPYKAFSRQMTSDEPTLELDVTAKRLDERDGFERLPAVADSALFHERDDHDTRAMGESRSG